MSIADAVTSESRTFEADVSKLLHLMAHQFIGPGGISYVS